MGAIGALVIIGVAVFLILRFGTTRGDKNVAANKTPVTRYALGDPLDDGDYTGRIEAVSRDGKYGAGYCLSNDAFGDKDGWTVFKTILAVVELETRRWISDKKGPNSDYDSEYPHVAAITNEGDVFAIHGNEDDEVRIVALNQHGERQWARKLGAKNIPLDAKCDQVELSYDSTKLFAEWLGIGVVLFDAKSGKKLWLRRWKNDEFGLDVEFEGDCSLVAHFVHDGPSGEIREKFPVGDKGQLPPEYYVARDAARANDEKADHRVVIPKLKKALSSKPPNIDEARELVTGIRPHYEKVPDKWRAKLLRFEGEVNFAEGKGEVAVALWARALEIDPKVGIASRYKREAKKLGRVPPQGS